MGIKSSAFTLSTKAKVIISAVAVAVVGTVVSAVIFLTGSTDTYRVLKVFELSGSAVITREGTGTLDAYVGMNLQSGDVLTVDDDSTLRISMDNDKYIQLEGGTVLELVAEGTPADSRTSIKLKKGTILNELTSSLSANSSYEVSTPKSTMAVRGTSFLVSVVENDDGSYTITVQTFHGKVEVILLDENGNPTGKTALVGEDNSVIIRTIENEKTGNPAEIDGISFFVFDKGDGIYVEVPEGENPIAGIDYSKISESIKRQLLASNDTNLLVLSNLVEGKLRGYSADAETDEEIASAATTTMAPQTTTTAPDLDTTTTTAPVTAPPINTDSVTTATTTVVMPTSTTTVTNTSTTKETTPAATAKETKASTTTTETKITTATPPTTTTSIPVIPVLPIITTTAVTTEITTTTTTVPVETTTTTTTVTVETTTTTTTPETPELEKFIVSFVSNGVTVYSEEVESGSTVSYIPEVPEKTGYTGKWVYNGAEFTSSITITADITVQAEYTINSYTVTFLKEDGTDITRTVNYGTTVTDIPEVPEKTGYTGKWMYNGAEFTSSITITADITVQAEYTINTYTVTFMANDELVDTRTAVYDTAVTSLPIIPDRDGHTGKWVYNGAEFTTSTKVKDNITVTAEYTINTYTVTFMADDELVDTRTAVYDTAVTSLPDVPEKTGFTDGKWMYDGSEFTTETVIQDNIIVTAEYTALYTVTYVLKCADTDETKEIEKLENVREGAAPDAVVLPVVVETGSNKYYLLGFTNPVQPITEDTTIYVNYELYDNVYQIKITDAGGLVDTGVATIGTQITLPSEDEVELLEHCTFIGWGYTNSGGYSDPNIKENASENSDDVDNYRLNVTANYDPGSTITLSDGNRLDGGGYYGLDNYKFFAVYEGDMMTVTFVDESNNVLSEIQVAYGDEFAKYEYEDLLPAITGYDIIWTYNGEELTSYYTEVVGNMTIVGSYVASS